MDGSDNVHDEVLVKLWRKYWQFYRPYIVNDTVYYIDNNPVRHIYCDYICVQQTYC